MAWSQGLGWNSRFGWEKLAATGGTSRTTLFTWNQFNSGGGFTDTAGSITADRTQTDADGGSTASIFTADGTSAQHKVARTMSITASAVTVFSVYAKQGTNVRFALREDQQTGKGNIFDINAGTVAGNLVGGVGTMTLVGGFYLCETQFTAAASAFAGFRISLLQATNTDLSFETNTSSDTIILYNAKVQTIP